MNWLPIETAPKDGTEVLVCDKYGNRHVAAFLAQMYFGHETRPAWMYGEIGDPYHNEEVEVVPTHWMPLPPLPNNAKAAEGKSE